MTSMRVLSEPSRTTVPGDADAVREDSRATLPPTARVRRALSAEELIDLEQQADFFIVLGQEDAAIDLLMGHVRSSGGTSPMPYLKLLEIYRRRSDADAYDRIRERLNRRFNGQAPAWDDAPKDSRSLDDHPEVQARVQAQWKTPARAVELLEALLFRRDASAGPFDLPAYEDLLFLYAVARDHLEREVNPDGVDLLLPIGNEEQVSSIQHAETRPPEAWMQSPPSSVDLELDLDASRRARR
jgi:hypothetical protein